MQNPIFIIAFSILLIMILSKIRIIRVDKEKSDIERYETDDNDQLIITGYMDKLRKFHNGLSDIEILNKATIEFRSLFEKALERLKYDKNKVDEVFDIQVFFDLSNKNILISKASAKTEMGEQVLEYMNKTLGLIKE